MLDVSSNRISAAQLFLIFSRIGLTSFGGGLSAWLLREFVQSRKWLTEEEFLNGLAISQALPGINVTNMAIWIGYRLRGNSGAIASFLGIIVLPGILMVLVGTFFASLQGFNLTHVALDGAAAAAVGLSLSIGLTAAHRVSRKAIPLGIMVATFIAIGVLHWPLVWTVLVSTSASIALAHMTTA
jgi:chromate transporter